MANKLFEFIYNEELKSSSSGFLDKLKRKLNNTAFSYINNSDDLIDAKIGNYTIVLPVSHKLPFIIRDNPHYSTNLARIATLVHQKYNDLTFIDIGANVGDSIALLRTEADFPILCVEGNNYFYSILELNAKKFDNIYISKNYVGDLLNEVSAVSVETGGTAHLIKSSSTENTVQIKSLSNILESFPTFKNSKMIKIDTDGYDLKIIKGATDILNSAMPIVFFEYDPFFLLKQNEEPIEIFDILKRAGYKNLLIYENNGELLLSTDINNSKTLEDITNFYSGRNGLRYCDICAFSEVDNDLFDETRIKEHAFFSKNRF